MLHQVDDFKSTNMALYLNTFTYTLFRIIARNRHQTHHYQSVKAFSAHCTYATSISTFNSEASYWDWLNWTLTSVRQLTGSEGQRWRKRHCAWHNFGSEQEPHHQRPCKYRADAYDTVYVSPAHILYCKALGRNLFSAGRAEKVRKDQSTAKNWTQTVEQQLDRGKKSISDATIMWIPNR